MFILSFTCNFRVRMMKAPHQLRNLKSYQTVTVNSICYKPSVNLPPSRQCHYILYKEGQSKYSGAIEELSVLVTRIL